MKALVEWMAMRSGSHSTRRRSLAVAVFLLLIVDVELGSRSVSAQTAEDPAAPVLRAIVAAEKALQGGEPQLAESEYRNALLEGWMVLGALAVADQDLERAKWAYEMAETCAFETRRARLSLAAVHLKMGDPAEAILILRKIISTNVRDLAPRRLLAQALAANGQLGESVQELEELRAMFPDDLENLYLLAAGYLRQEQPEKAQELFTELASRRDIPQTQVLIGRTYRDFDDFDYARAALEAALVADPTVKRAHYYLGTVEVFERGQDGLDDAIDQFEAELEVSPDDPMTNLYLGMALVEERREEEAISPLQVASRSQAHERDALQYLGTAYLRAGRPDDAVPALQRALELAEQTPIRADDDSLLSIQLSQISKLHYQLGLALRRMGDEAAAAEQFAAAEASKARETEDSRDRMQRFLGDTSENLPQEAFGSPLEIAEIADLSPQERLAVRDNVTKRLAHVYLNLGVLQAQARHLVRAGDLLAQAAELDPDFPQVQYSLGITRFNSGQFELATAPLARALEVDPQNAELRRMLALAWLNSGGYDKAAALLEVDSEVTNDRNLQFAYGMALVRSGRAAEAEPIFADLLSRYPDWAELKVYLGQAYAQQDDYDAAIAVLEEALELQSDVPEANGTLGEIYFRHGQLEEAEKALRAEIEISPDDLRWQYLLATVLDLAGKSDEALDYLEALLEKSPRAANARYLIGKILLAEGNAEEAQIQLETAMRLDPADPEVHYQLGLALQRQGRVEEASREFETYRSLKKNDSGEEP